jgi:hypothetical protein
VIGSAIAGLIEFFRLTLRTLAIDIWEEVVFVRDILGKLIRLPVPASGSLPRPANDTALEFFALAPGRSSGSKTSSFLFLDNWGENVIPRED